MPTITYQTAGVDIDKGDQFVEILKPLVKQTFIPGVLGSLGGFSGLFRLGRYREPLLASTTDGVGTKLKLALEYGWLDGIGIDLVGMVLNDLLPCGARPLFMLDYFATGKLNLTQATTVLNGIVRGCKECHTALIGGETAEMPGLYSENDFDIAGFGVGVVERRNVIDGKKVRRGDLVIGLPSSGFHSNGYSLIRKIVDLNAIDLHRPNPSVSNDIPIGRRLLEPTRLYVDFIIALIDSGLPIHGMAHNTGGGVVGNLPRAFPSKFSANIEKRIFNEDPLFDYVAKLADLPFEEKVRTFNCGIGYFVIIASRDLNRFEKVAKKKKQAFQIVGTIEAHRKGGPEVLFR